AAPLERDQRLVAGIRLRGPGRVLQPASPRGLADLGVGQVVLDRGLLLGSRVARPYALRAAEVGDARLGGDAGAGERHHAVGGVYPLADAFDGAACGHGLACSGRPANLSRRCAPLFWQCGGAFATRFLEPRPYSTPFSRSSAIRAASSPSSPPSTASVCSPSSGGPLS